MKENLWKGRIVFDCAGAAVHDKKERIELNKIFKHNKKNILMPIGTCEKSSQLDIGASGQA